jgi:uncharacterized metal-binding protein
MSDLVESKVGIVACSGEELAEGTVARLAALKVLNELRPRDTVTICLPLFLAGGAGDRAFAKLHPTITVDGCGLRCAARGTERHSSKPVASLVVNEIVAECGLDKPKGLRRLNEAGQKAVEVTAGRLAALVDRALGKEPGSAPAPETGELEAEGPAREATCSCGSGVPVTRVTIEGRMVELVALPLILRKFREAGRGQDEEALRELFETVKVYNAVPPEAEERYREAVRNEYAAFCAKEETR